MRRIIYAILILVFLVVLLLAGYTWYQLRDRHPGYEVDIEVQGNPPQALQAGFSARSITPDIPDAWVDSDGDAQYDPEKGDTYKDGNGNGRFDPVWLAGFQNRRPAQGVHDPLWARTMVLDDGTTRIGLIALDAIGFMSDDIIDIRKSLDESLNLDYLIITSTHTHEAPDLLGLWGGSEYKSGVDPDYLALVKAACLRSVEEATAALRPARIRLGHNPDGATHLVEDSRLPAVTDPGLRLLQAIDAEADTTLGTLVQWSNHPETLWSKNLLITSDFPHYVREGIERGVMVGDSLARPGLGGICIYVNGAIGGLMTTSPSFGIPALAGDTTYQEPSYAKAAAQGYALAQLGLQALADTVSTLVVEQEAIRLRAKSLELPLDNPLYRLAAILGVIDRGTPSWMHVRSEVAAWRLGPATFLHQPGELYPEILNGGVERAPGGDFDMDPVETPPLRELMPGQFTFTVGLSNDMIGYIIPRSEWDEEPPFLYGADSSPYGEINSVGPDTGPLLYQAMVEVLQDIQ